MSANGKPKPVENSGGVTGKGCVKGQSGNPGGRPKGIAAKARELCGDDGELLAQFWLDAMNNTEEPMSARLKASELLVERGYGKAPSFVPIGEEDPLGLKEDIDRGIDSIMD